MALSSEDKERRAIKKEQKRLETLKRKYTNALNFEHTYMITEEYVDQILNDYQMLIQSMYLTKYIAEKKSKDLSKVEYSPIVKKLYKYNGQI